MSANERTPLLFPRKAKNALVTIIATVAITLLVGVAVVHYREQGQWNPTETFTAMVNSMSSKDKNAGPLKPMKLPFAYDALEPWISKKTVFYHYEKHYGGYVTAVNNLTSGNWLGHLPIEDIIQISNKTGNAELYAMAAQVWNHEFLWKCLRPPSRATDIEIATVHNLVPSVPGLDKQIDKDFGNRSELFAQIKHLSTKTIGSGWVWLYWNVEEEKLQLAQLHDAKTPVMESNVVPLFTIDVWEHAYYLDYQNLRGDYVDAVLHHLVNWPFVADRLVTARHGEAPTHHVSDWGSQS